MLMNLATRASEVSRVMFAFLGLNLVLVNVMLPFLAFVLFTDALATLPVPAIVAIGVGAWTLSAPGLAAAFATYRDADLMRPTETPEARETRAAVAADVDAIAPSYWRDAEDTRIIRPFLRAYVRLFVRTLQASFGFGILVALLIVAALRVLSLGGGAVSATLLGIVAFLLISSMVALTLIVELPRATSIAIIRTAVVMTGRRPLLAVSSLVVFVGYLALLLFWPFLVLTVGAGGLIFFFSSHISHAIARPVIDMVVMEERAPSRSVPRAPEGAFAS